MASKTCAHRDVQEFDNLRCCMSCGETLHLWQLPQRSKHTSTTKTHTSIQGLAHNYSDLRLITGEAIRLIVLLPARFADPIWCTIATVDPYKEQYDAVSYTWATEDGDYSKTGRIHCPDGVISVTENYEAALRRLRLPSAPRQLWVDAICIDQTNIKERNHQVGLMDVIFRLASAVHICIQDPSHNYTGLVNILKSDAFHCPESIAVSQAAELIRRSYFSRVWYVSTPDTIDQWYPFRPSFFNLTFYYRVIQEVLLAKEIVLHINSDEVTLNRSALFLLNLLIGHVSKAPSLIRSITSLHSSIQALQPTSASQDRGLLECLRLSVMAHSSDPRDQIFGVLSLLRPRTRALIPVDYSLNYQQVFGLTVMLCIAERCNLGILMYASLPDNTELESACTFGLREFRSFVTGRGYNPRDYYFDPSLLGSRIPWKSRVLVNMLSETTQKSYTVVVEPESTAGLGSVVQLSSDQFPPQQILPRMKISAHLLDISYDSVRTASTLPNYLENIENIPSKMLLEDENFGSSGDSCDWNWLGRLFQHPKKNKLSERLIQKTSSPAHSLFKDYEFKTFAKEIEPFPISTMFRTHYSVGFSDSNHKAGDCVFAIDGVRKPFLLRQVSSNTYRIVGHCYLWAARHLDYWTPGTYKGLWLERPFDLGECTRMIEIY